MEDIVIKRMTDMLGNEVRETYKNGELCDRSTYNSNGELVEEFIPGDLRSCYFYDENGDEIECNQYLMQEDGTEEHAFHGLKKYDEDGRLIEYEYENIYDGHFLFTYKYETLEGKLLQKEYDQNGDLVGVVLVEN